MKKNNKKRNIIVWAFASVLFLSIFSSAIGQEYIRGTDQYLLCDSSIIRAIGNDSVLIYNRRYTSTFMLMTAGMNPVPILYLRDSIYVNDFEVDGSIVYFCGYKLNERAKEAVFGTFSILTFPNVTVVYNIVDSCAELKKLEYYTYGDMTYSEFNIVMTGTTTGERSDVLVHTISGATVPAPPFTNPFDVYSVYFSSDRDESFDDVAATENYVVVSTRNKMNDIPIIDFWQFEKQTAPFMSLLYSNIHHIRMGSPIAETPVFLESSTGDNYSAIFKIDGMSRMAMLQLTAPVNVNTSVEISGDDALTIIPIDIKYNKLRNDFDILARRIHYRDEPEQQFIPMQIYHVTQTVINNTVPLGMGTNYPERRLWSIDPTESTAYFVASGSAVDAPRLFKYHYYQWKRCPQQFEYQYDTWEPKGAVDKDSLTKIKWYDKEPKKPITDCESISFPFICEE